MSSEVQRATEESVGCSDHKRFEIELEFIQSLASPQYINWLAQKRYFDDTAFINYLNYLSYWRQPEYACYIIYPHCLYFLELLLSRDFRNSMASNNSKELLHSQQLYFYQHYRRNRLKSEEQQLPG